MALIDDLEDVISTAEDVLVGASTTPYKDKAYLETYVGRLAADEPPSGVDWFHVNRFIHLAQLFVALGLKQLARSVVDMTLSNLDLAEAEKPETSSDLWNDLGTLLVELGDLPLARTVISRALNRAHYEDNPRVAGILTNLSAVSLKAGDHRAARLWAEKARATKDWADDLEARLTTQQVLVDVARAEQDIPGLERALTDLGDCVEALVRAKGKGHPRAFAARTALATARFRAAMMQKDAKRRDQQLEELELIRLNSTLSLGADQRQSIVAQAALATAEFEAAPKAGSAGKKRRLRAVEIMEAAASTAERSQTLGREHPLTHSLRQSLADMRAEAVPSAQLPYLIEHTYTPQQNDDRNHAKREAISREEDTIRLIAHAGASYFLSGLSVFHSPIVQALDRGVRFHVIISSPWNNLAVFMQRDAAAEPVSYQNIVERVANSDYVQQTFRPVIASYLDLRKKYRRQIELRLTSMDIPGSTLLTSDMGFFEPYITSNPERRTRRGLSVFEVTFRNDSRYYWDSIDEFSRQWDFSSTWQQFHLNEERHKQTLRSAIEAVPDTRLRKGVRDSAESRP